MLELCFGTISVKRFGVVSSSTASKDKLVWGELELRLPTLIIRPRRGLPARPERITS